MLIIIIIIILWMEPTKEWENHTESRLQMKPQLVAWKIFSSLDVRELYWVGDFRNTYLQMIKMLPFELDQRKWYSEIVLLGFSRRSVTDRASYIRLGAPGSSGNKLKRIFLVELKKTKSCRQRFPFINPQCLSTNSLSHRQSQPADHSLA